jgi:hypothetical protein
MGEVFEAEDLKLGQTVALKFLSEGFGRDEGRLARLLKEVRVARQVSHPNVCRVYDVGESEGRHFLTMEHIEGRTLDRVLERGERLPPDEALALARQLAAGLAAAHERGVLHRDLKPSNVMIDDRGVVRVTDFGLAEVMERVEGSRAREGTPSYMAPEALEGAEVTTRSDLYSLGLVLYEIFAGKAAYPQTRTIEETIAARRSSLPPPASLAREIDPAAARVVLRCLETDPAERPASARAVAEALPGGRAFAAAAQVAQRRADRIAAFREELGDLRRAGVVHLDDATAAGIETYHGGVLTDLVRDFDVDVSEREKQISLGMRIVSVLGAIALAASAFYFFYRIWGRISFPSQVAVLAGAPLLALVATSAISLRDRSGHFAAMAAAAAFSCAVVNVLVLSSILNAPLAPLAFLAWGAVAMATAYAHRLRVPLVAGLVSLGAFFAALGPTLFGFAWRDFMERPGGFMPAGLLALVAPDLGAARRYAPFAPVYRLVGLVMLLWPTLILSVEGQQSYLPFAPGAVEIAHQILGFAGSTAAIVIGVRRRFAETAYVGFVFFVAHLFFRFADWCWDWMPRYLFFLILALAAIAVLFALKRLRARMAGPEEVRP